MKPNPNPNPNRAAPLVMAEPHTRLPPALHHRGAPTPWTEMTRPGQRLHSFLEGLHIDAQGGFWVCDVPHGRVFHIDPGGRWETALAYRGEPHSVRCDGGGRLLIADHQHGLLAFAEARENHRYRVLARGRKGLSDMAIAPDGAVWFSDAGRTSLADPSGGLYRYGADGGLAQILDNIPHPNGVAVSPCGAHIYVAATRANAVWRLAAEPAGGVVMAGVHLQLSGGLGPDGLATNDLGHLAVAQAQAGRAYVFDPPGDLRAEVRIPGDGGLWTTSVAFDPRDDARLYVVEAQSGGIFRADLAL